MELVPGEITLTELETNGSHQSHARILVPDGNAVLTELF